MVSSPGLSLDCNPPPDLEALLSQLSLDYLATRLESETLHSLIRHLGSIGRVAFLSFLKALGVTHLTHRQTLCNGLSRLARTGHLKGTGRASPTGAVEPPWDYGETLLLRQLEECGAYGDALIYRERVSINEDVSKTRMPGGPVLILSPQRKGFWKEVHPSLNVLPAVMGSHLVHSEKVSMGRHAAQVAPPRAARIQLAHPPHGPHLLPPHLVRRDASQTACPVPTSGDA